MTKLNNDGVLYPGDVGQPETQSYTPDRRKQAIFGYGANDSGTSLSMTNLVSYLGNFNTDTTGVGTARYGLAAASYGGDRVIFAFGTNGSTNYNNTNFVSNLGVVLAGSSGVGTARKYLAASSYGGDKAIFAFGETGNGILLSITNLVSNLGVIVADPAGPFSGTPRAVLAAAGYGGDKAIFGFGYNGTPSLASYTNTITLFSNVGAYVSESIGIGTSRGTQGGASYGGDRAIFGYGITSAATYTNVTNKVSNLGIVDSDTIGVGTSRSGAAASNYGGDKAIFAFGNAGASLNMSNKVTNLGVVAENSVGVGTARISPAAASFGE